MIIEKSPSFYAITEPILSTAVQNLPAERMQSVGRHRLRRRLEVMGKPWQNRYAVSSEKIHLRNGAGHAKIDSKSDLERMERIDRAILTHAQFQFVPTFRIC